MRRIAVGALAALVLGGCASAPRIAGDDQAQPQADADFDVAGRLSARHSAEAAAAHFRWKHRRDSDELLISTPLGQALARLVGSANTVSLELPDGRTAQAPDWEALTAKVLGAPMPVRGLAWWVRGSPHASTPHTIEREAAGRAGVLRQDGWVIVYEYADSGSRPARLRLTYPDVEIRLVLDSWGD